MGFSSQLSMFNFKRFLHNLALALQEQGVIKDGTVLSAESFHLKGFGPQVKDFSVAKDGEVLIGFQADEEGYSCWGNKDLKGYSVAKEAIDKLDLEASVEAIKALIDA